MSMYVSMADMPSDVRSAIEKLDVPGALMAVTGINDEQAMRNSLKNQDAYTRMVMAINGIGADLDRLQPFKLRMDAYLNVPQLAPEVVMPKQIVSLPVAAKPIATAKPVLETSTPPVSIKEPYVYKPALFQAPDTAPIDWSYPTPIEPTATPASNVNMILVGAIGAGLVAIAIMVRHWSTSHLDQK